ncbi:hypothetical protein PILCRDRAFT_93379 [Piloderma croceum F 1598]|uniref:Uncharacterized protein n=1 Tax=Piloderma croceum (strain F 1598) TaxID=765440 RepID=A0A0C3EY52_PILCF|nr:hypothetical protein PILCRDRAFT_93379 [Piloderma croceum F 1598]
MHATKWYSAAYKALSLIDLNGKWMTQLKYLDHNKDLQSPRCNDDDGSCETTRELSQIWLVPHEDGPPKEVASPNEINDTMQCEWPKAKAQADQWKEEVLLVTEEMHQTICFFLVLVYHTSVAVAVLFCCHCHSKVEHLQHIDKGVNIATEVSASDLVLAESLLPDNVKLVTSHGQMFKKVVKSMFLGR